MEQQESKGLLFKQKGREKGSTYERGTRHSMTTNQQQFIDLIAEGMPVKMAAKESGIHRKINRMLSNENLLIHHEYKRISEEITASYINSKADTLAKLNYAANEAFEKGYIERYLNIQKEINKMIEGHLATVKKEETVNTNNTVRVIDMTKPEPTFEYKEIQE